MSETKNLKSVAEIYKSDKIEHGYIEIYESYFEKIRDEKLKIFEIGIADGKSLLTWADYFKKYLKWFPDLFDFSLNFIFS